MLHLAILLIHGDLFWVVMGVKLLFLYLVILVILIFVYVSF